MLLGMALLFIASCQESKPRYLTSSPEIDEVKALMRDYENANWDAWMTHYADTAKIYHNTVDGVTPKVAQRGLKNTIDFMDTYNFSNQEMFYEMVIDDDQLTWVYFWGTWIATLTETGVELVVPVHIASLMVNGKIAAEYGFYDTYDIQKAVEDLVMDDIEIEEAFEEEETGE